MPTATVRNITVILDETQLGSLLKMTHAYWAAGVGGSAEYVSML